MIKIIINNLRIKYCLTRLCCEQIKTAQNNLHKNYLHTSKYFILFSLLQVFKTSQNSEQKYFSISQYSELFSYEDYLENLNLTDKKLKQMSEEFYFDQMQAHIYMFKCQIIKDFVNLLNDEHEKQNLIDFIKYLIEKIDIFAKRNKNLLLIINLNTCYENLIKNLNKLKRMDETIFDEKIDKLYAALQYKYGSNLDIFIYSNFFNIYINLLDENKDKSFEKFIISSFFLKDLDKLSVFHAFFIITNIFTFITILKFRVENTIADNKKYTRCLENFQLKLNVSVFITKLKDFFRIYTNDHFVYFYNTYNKGKNIYGKNIILMNDKLKQSACSVISRRIKATIQLENSILIFLLFAEKYKYGKYNDWELLKHDDIDKMFNKNLVLICKNLESDLENQLGLKLKVKFEFTSDDLCILKFKQFLELYVVSITDVRINKKIFFLLFLLTNKITFTHKENENLRNSFNLKNYLLGHLTYILTTHILDNVTRENHKSIYSNYLNYTMGWLKYFINNNMYKFSTNVNWKDCDCGISYEQNSNVIYFKYVKFSLDEFVIIMKKFQDEKSKKNAHFLFQMIIMFYVEFFNKNKKNENILKIIEELRKYINTHHSSLWSSI